MSVLPNSRSKFATATTNAVREHPESLGAVVRNGAARATAAVLLAIAAIPAGGVLAHAAEQVQCRPGTFCAWGEKEFRGEAHRASADNTKLETCVSLPGGLEASSFVNRTGHPVTVYQDPNCDSHADFSTYPSGSHVPEGPYVARAIKIWTH